MVCEIHPNKAVRRKLSLNFKNLDSHHERVLYHHVNIENTRINAVECSNRCLSGNQQTPKP